MAGNSELARRGPRVSSPLGEPETAASGKPECLEPIAYEKGIDMVHTEEPVYSKGDGYRGKEVTGWVGWVFFAGILMFTVGIVNIIEGLVALFNDKYYLVRPNGLVVSLDFTAWGWALLLFGLLLVFAGYGALVGQTWARVTGVILAVVNAVVNLAFVPAYPIWTIIVITLDVLVIYALVVHGGEVKRVAP
jgi:hypothetical protein